MVLDALLFRGRQLARLIGGQHLRIGMLTGIPAGLRHPLLQGLADLGLVIAHDDASRGSGREPAKWGPSAFRSRRRAWKRWTFTVSGDRWSKPAISRIDLPLNG